MSEMNDAPRDPMRAALANMRPQAAGCFFKAVEGREADGRAWAGTAMRIPSIFWLGKPL